MAILLYCVGEADRAANGLLTGVARVPVLLLKRQGLVTFASQSTTAEVWTKRPLYEAALEFHHVLEELFRSNAILPFRFPTILESEEEFAAHLDQRARDYRTLLEKFRTSVQLEALLTSQAAREEPRAMSGTEYLRGKRQSADSVARWASELQLAAGELAKQWRIRVIQSGLRCFALVERDLVSSFRKTLENVAQPDGFRLRVSGPWPATEFLNLNRF